VRETNEDHYLVIHFHRTLENVFTNIPGELLEKSFDIVGYCALVADGIGGEVASRLALISSSVRSGTQHLNRPERYDNDSHRPGHLFKDYRKQLVSIMRTIEPPPSLWERYIRRYIYKV
jgi:hypothetical protein